MPLNLRHAWNDGDGCDAGQCGGSRRFAGVWRIEAPAEGAGGNQVLTGEATFLLTGSSDLVFFVLLPLLASLGLNGAFFLTFLLARLGKTAWGGPDSTESVP
jgi:hypothetical protein